MASNKIDVAKASILTEDCWEGSVILLNERDRMSTKGSDA
jgi:hypothetical protein